MSKIKNLEDLKNVVTEKWFIFNEVGDEYLNDAGKAVKSAYRSVIWCCGFHDDLEELVNDEDYMGLVNLPGQHPKYYSTLHMIDRSIRNSLQED